jgi:hypothetical protein
MELILLSTSTQLVNLMALMQVLSQMKQFHGGKLRKQQLQ